MFTKTVSLVLGDAWVRARGLEPGQQSWRKVVGFGSHLGRGAGFAAGPDGGGRGLELFERHQGTPPQHGWGWVGRQYSLRWGVLGGGIEGNRELNSGQRSGGTRW